MKTPGERLTYAREQAGYPTARAAAIAVGAALSTYAQHELAEKFLPARRAHRYASFFGVSPEWLLYGRNGQDSDGPGFVPLLGKTACEVREVHGPVGATAYTHAYEITAEDGLGPNFAGWTAYFELVDAENDPFLTGPLSVVCILHPDPDHTRGLRVGRLHPSARQGYFHLMQDFGTTNFDLTVEWAARITALSPP